MPSPNYAALIHIFVKPPKYDHDIMPLSASRATYFPGTQPAGRGSTLLPTSDLQDRARRNPEPNANPTLRQEWTVTMATRRRPASTRVTPIVSAVVFHVIFLHPCPLPGRLTAPQTGNMCDIMLSYITASQHTPSYPASTSPVKHTVPPYLTAAKHHQLKAGSCCKWPVNNSIHLYHHFYDIPL